MHILDAFLDECYKKSHHLNQHPFIQQQQKTVGNHPFYSKNFITLNPLYINDIILINENCN